MNIKALQCFIKVYEKKSITAASKEIYISPQGLSKIIKQLEIDLETELFFRGTQGMEATESGELLYARARHICYLMEDIKKEIGIINGSKGALNIVSTYSATSAVPLETLFRFSEIFPNIQINIQEYPDEYPVRELFIEEADAGILVGNEGIKNCSYEMLYPGEIVLVVAEKHKLADRETVSFKDLEQERFILKSTEAGRDNCFIEKCISHGFNPVILYETGNMSSLHSLCSITDGVGVSIDFLEKQWLREDQRIIRLKEKIPQNVFLVSRNRDIQNRAVSLFLKYVKENMPKCRH